MVQVQTHGMQVRIMVAIGIREGSIKTLIMKPIEFECIVQPPPFYYGNDQALEIEAEYRAKLKYLVQVEKQMKEDEAFRSQLEGKTWYIDAVVMRKTIIG